jgi:hypothetical protein
LHVSNPNILYKDENFIILGLYDGIAILIKNNILEVKK